MNEKQSEETAEAKRAAEEKRYLIALADYHTKCNMTSGWFIPDESTSSIARDTFFKMIQVIKTGGQVDVVACVDGKEYHWQCDGLKYARRERTAREALFDDTLPS